MSFATQERLLLELLFDNEVRHRFINNMEAMLADYDLEQHEINDFKTIRIEALEVDAGMRRHLFLSHICLSLPVTFSLFSSFENGISLLKENVNAELMLSPPIERATLFGNKLREQLPTLPNANAKEHSFITAIVEAELGMIWTATTLKQVMLEKSFVEEETQNQITDWSSRPVKLASYVSAAMLPQPYSQLKQKLCPGDHSNMWTELTQKPLKMIRRNKVLANEDPRLLVARAMVSYQSVCEPAIDHQTIELSEGFAHLFQHINGTSSIDQLLAAFKQAGAPASLLNSVKTGFKNLVDKNMLIVG
ncbi:MAG: hypothetical protein AAF410_04675 [Pseudomonadota bacterium]